MSADEQIPLLTRPSSTDTSFFHRLKNRPMQAIKKTGLVVASVFSGYMYWPSSFSSAASISSVLAYPAALGGSATNALFNYESFLSLTELPKFRSMPSKYIIATLFSIACIAPNFFMDIYDEEKKEYIDSMHMALQASTAFLNIWVNIIGTLELIENIQFLVKTKNLDTQKREKIKRVIENFYHLPVEKQTNTNFNAMLKPSNKLTYYLLNTFIGTLSIPQFTAYILISYFGMKDLAKDAWHLGKPVSIILGLIAALGNAIPGAGFSIKGVNSISKKLMSLEKPSLLAILFIIPALFSGFTTHKAMADSLKKLGFSKEKCAIIITWVANFGAALIYNTPQILDLKTRWKKKPVITNAPSAEEIISELENLDNNQLTHFIETSLYTRISFFRPDPTGNISINNNSSSNPALSSIAFS